MASALETVANSTDRHDTGRVSRVVFDDLPERANVDIDSSLVTNVIAPPRTVEDLLAAERERVVANQKGQKIELPWTQL